MKNQIFKLTQLLKGLEWRLSLPLGKSRKIGIILKICQIQIRLESLKPKPKPKSFSFPYYLIFLNNSVLDLAQTRKEAIAIADQTKYAEISRISRRDTNLFALKPGDKLNNRQKGDLNQSSEYTSKLGKGIF